MTRDQWRVTVTISGRPFLGEPRRLGSSAGLCLSSSWLIPKWKHTSDLTAIKTAADICYSEPTALLQRILPGRVQVQKTVAEIEDTRTKDGILYLKMES